MMRTLHHWFGAAFAAFFFVISVSGSWLVIDRYVFVPSVTTKQNQGDVIRTPVGDSIFVSRILEAYPLERISRISFPIKEKPVYLVELTNGTAVYFEDAKLTIAGEVTPGLVTNFMVRIHTNLLNPWGIGHEIVIWTGLIAIFLSVIGLIIFIPSHRSFRKNRVLLPKELTFKDVRRTHLSSGIVFSFFIIFFGATGWMIGEPEDARQILSPSIETPLHATKEQPLILTQKNVPEIIEDAFTKLPEHTLTLVDFSRREQSQAIYLHTKTANDYTLYGTGRIKIDLSEGVISAHSLGDDKTLLSTVFHNAYSLHTGQGRNLLYKLLIAILGIVVATVSLMGLLSYSLKWRVKIIRYLSARRKVTTNPQGDIE